ncbi:hypothetical protein BGW41_007450 [Actinomortierella wolfii]|nr:hypothetical protein BGW41_007450 [Actinomortierella wolfii]
MRTYGMSAREAIAYLRIMRPGSVVGHQQTWLARHESKFIAWRNQPLGPVVEQYRRLLGLSNPGLEITSSGGEEDGSSVETSEKEKDDDNNDDDSGGDVDVMDNEDDEIDIDAVGSNKDEDSGGHSPSTSETLGLILDNIAKPDSLGIEDQVSQIFDQKLTALDETGKAGPAESVEEDEEDVQRQHAYHKYPVLIQPRKSAAHDMQLGSEEAAEDVRTDPLTRKDPLFGKQPFGSPTSQCQHQSQPANWVTRWQMTS